MTGHFEDDSFHAIDCMGRLLTSELTRPGKYKQEHT